jgi:signal transduction histidine kinase
MLRRTPSSHSILHSLGSGARRLLLKPTRALRGRLLYALLALLLVLAALEVEQDVERDRGRRALLDRVASREAVATAAAARAGLAYLEEAQQAVGLAVLGRTTEAAEADAYLERVHARFPNLASIEVFDRGGTLLGAFPPLETRPSAPDLTFLRDLSHLQPRLLTRVFTDSPPDREKIRIASLIEVSVPGSEVPETLGVVSMEFYVDALKSLLPAQREKQVSLLLDEEGRRIADNSDEDVEALVRRSPAVRRAVTASQPVTIHIQPRRGDGLSGYAIVVPETRWVVVHLRHDAEGFAEVRESARRSLLLTAMVVLILTATLLALLRIGLRPLVRLSAAARKLGSGDLAYRVPPAEVEEFEPLVQAFNGMAQRLERAQQELVAANQALEDRVRARTAELEEEHQKRLRAERLSTVGLFSSAIAHDLRSPLNTIGLGLHNLRARLGEGVDPRVLRQLDTMERELRRADQIIRTLLGFARTGELHREPVELDRLVEEVVRVAPIPAEVALRLDLAHDGEPVPLDRAQVFQVVENLVRNAVEAMGGQGELYLRTWRRNGSCGLEVTDTGPGIPEEQQAQVFEPLVTTKSAGTGLGLALCKRIVEAHGGRIDLRSAPGEGATFTLTLPVVDAPPSPDPAAG